MLTQGINQSKACVLIALDDMFGDTDIDWGQDFLEDYFLESGNDGFQSDHFYLIGECAPVILFQEGLFTISWSQGDQYLSFIDRNTGLRYRVYKNTKVIFVYTLANNIGHAVCLPAHAVMLLVNKDNFSALVLPKFGTIIDTARCD